MDDSRCRRRRSAAPAAPPPQPRARSGLPGWARRSRYCCNVRGKACLQACPSLFLTALGADLERMFPHLRFLPPCLFEGRRLGQSWCTCSHMLEVVEVLYHPPLAARNRICPQAQSSARGIVTRAMIRSVFGVGLTLRFPSQFPTGPCVVSNVAGASINQHRKGIPESGFKNRYRGKWTWRGGVFLSASIPIG